MNFYPLPKFYGTSWAWRRAKRSAFFHQETHPAQYKRRWAKTTRSKSPGATWAMAKKKKVKIEKSWIFNGILWWLMGFNGIWPMKKWGSQNQHSWSQALFFFTLSVDLFRPSQMQQSGTQESLNWHQGHPEIHVECWHLKTTWTKRRDLTKHRDTTHAICLHNFGAGNPKLDVWDFWNHRSMLSPVPIISSFKSP